MSLRAIKKMKQLQGKGEAVPAAQDNEEDEEEEPAKGKALFSQFG